ncbi:myb-like protein X isoform X1 [Tachysurus ichikawai]
MGFDYYQHVDDKQKESSTCVCMQPEQPILPHTQDTEAEEEKEEEIKQPQQKPEQAVKQVVDSELLQKKEDVDVVAPLQDLPACRPTPVYCPAPPGWYVHHIVTDSPLPPTPVREAQFAAIATHAVTLQRQDPMESAALLHIYPFSLYYYLA